MIWRFLMGRKKLDKTDKKKQYGFMLLPKHGNAIEDFAHTHGMTPSQLIDLFGSILTDKSDKVEKLLKLKATCEYDNEDELRLRMLRRAGIRSPKSEELEGQTELNFE